MREKRTEKERVLKLKNKATSLDFNDVTRFFDVMFSLLCGLFFMLNLNNYLRKIAFIGASQSYKAVFHYFVCCSVSTPQHRPCGDKQFNSQSVRNKAELG